MRILIIEDEPKTAAYVHKGLTEQGYLVDIAADGHGGLRLASVTEYDLILLDVMLPGIDGWAVLAALRRERQTPVLILSAFDEADIRAKSAQLGAQDYLAKPFEFSELLARVQERTRGGPAQAPAVTRFADVEIDPLRQRAIRAGRPIDLTPKEFALLDYFVRHAGELCSRTLIAENVWDMNFDSDSNVVDIAVRRLRAKLDDPYPTKLIHTIRGVGYVFADRSE
jgi:two-component system copper resistance phosphate regulon response regulator CusR